MDRDELTRYLHEQIPMSQHIGATVLRADSDVVRLQAPMEPNINHRKTAFGGSISALGMLAGWAYVFSRLRRQSFGGHVVIQQNSVEYRQPITEAFEAICRAPDEADWHQFTEMLERWGRGRVTLTASIQMTGQGETAAAFTGTYAALAPSP